MRPPSRESGWRGREDQGLNAACSIPKRAGKRERTGRGDPGSDQWRGVGGVGKEGVWDLGGKGDQLCKAP